VFWRTFGRLILIPIAVLIATAVAGFILVTLGLETITHAMHGREPGADTITAVLDLFWQGTLLASSLTIIPALAVIVVGEVARIRSWLYYMVGGGLALAAIPLLARLDQGEVLALPPAAVWQLFATAGFAAGLAYWLIAGRTA
jgi:hypothetical protein